MRLFAHKLAENRVMCGVAGALLPAVLLSGCNRNEEALLGRAIPVKPSQVLSGRPLGGRVFTIGIVSPPRSDESYAAALAGMEAAAVGNEVLLEQPPVAFAGENQQAQVRRLLAAKVNALLVWTPDPGTAADAVRTARATHTPVFTVGGASTRARPTAQFVTTAPVVDLTPDLIGRTAVDKIAAYLRGEKLKPWIVIRPEGNAGHRTK